MQPDVQWLLSTSAQAAAAMVAIIGGLLVARVVGIVSQRDGIQEEIRGAATRLTELERAKQIGDERELRLLVPRLRSWASTVAVVNRDGNPAVVEEHLRRTWGKSDPDFVAAVSRELVDDVQRVRGSVAWILAPGEVVSDPAELYRRGLRRVPGMALIEEGVVEQVARERRRASGEEVEDWQGSERGTPPYTEDLSSSYSTYITDHEIQEASLELRGLEQRLRDSPPPTGVISAAIILGLFSIVSIIMPMYWLAERPIIHDPQWKRAFVVVAFAAGVAAIFGYIIWLARRPRLPNAKVRCR